MYSLEELNNIDNGCKKLIHPPFLLSAAIVEDFYPQNDVKLKYGEGFVVRSDQVIFLGDYNTMMKLIKKCAYNLFQDLTQEQIETVKPKPGRKSGLFIPKAMVERLFVIRPFTPLRLNLVQFGQSLSESEVLQFIVWFLNKEVTRFPEDMDDFLSSNDFTSHRNDLFSQRAGGERREWVVMKSNQMISDDEFRKEFMELQKTLYAVVDQKHPQINPSRFIWSVVS